MTRNGLCERVRCLMRALCPIHGEFRVRCTAATPPPRLGQRCRLTVVGDVLQHGQGRLLTHGRDEAVHGHIVQHFVPQGVELDLAWGSGRVATSMSAAHCLRGLQHGTAPACPPGRASCLQHSASSRWRWRGRAAPRPRTPGPPRGGCRWRAPCGAQGRGVGDLGDVSHSVPAPPATLPPGRGGGGTHEAMNLNLPQRCAISMFLTICAARRRAASWRPTWPRCCAGPLLTRSAAAGAVSLVECWSGGWRPPRMRIGSSATA